MSIYSPLEHFLKSQRLQVIPMTFSEVAAVLGRALPQSAFRHRPWWANEATGHSHARAWLNAGFETGQVDMVQQKLVFHRIPPSSGLSEWSREFRPQNASPSGVSLFGALKGTFTFEAGGNPAAPALDYQTLDIGKTADLVDSGLRRAE